MNGAAGPALTARGWAALGCGLAAVVFGRLFGSPEIALLGAALVAAAVLARLWVGRSGGPHIAVRTLPAFAHAGESVRVALELRPLEGARSGRGAFRETGGGPLCALRPVTVGGLRVLRGSYELGPLSRGVHDLGAGLLVREDPFGLARRSDATRGSTALTVVGPPLELPEGPPIGRGGVAQARQRLRSGGHELHGVREHQPGESLRGVHWPATAHHGRLMVKELDDPAGDELAVVLDARLSAAVGSGPDSSFELAVAAAGALVARAHDEGRRARLVVAGLDGDPAGARERTAVRRLLARVRPAGERSPADLLTRLAAERIEVVTTRPGALIGARRTRGLGVVAIDPSSFDPAVPRDAAAIEALRAAGSRVLELRRPEPEPLAAAERPRAARARAARRPLRAGLRLRPLARARPADARALDGAARRDRRPCHRTRARGAARRTAARPAGAGAGGARRRVRRVRAVALTGSPARRSGGGPARRAWRLGAGGAPVRRRRAPRAARGGAPGPVRLARDAGLDLARAASAASGRPARPAAVRGQCDRLRPAAVPLARTARGHPAVRVPVHRPRGRRRACPRLRVRGGRARSRAGLGRGAGCLATRRPAVDDLDVLAVDERRRAASISSGT